MALCGSLYRMASDVTLDAIVTYATRLRREVGESLVSACVRREPAPSAFARLHPLGRREDAVKENAMVWWVTHYPAGDAPSRRYAVRASQLRRGHAQARRLSRRPRVDAPITREEDFDGFEPRRHAGRPAHRCLVRPALRPPGERPCRRRPRSLDRRRALQQTPAARRPPSPRSPPP